MDKCSNQVNAISIASLNEMDFDDWVALYEHNPERFEQYRMRILNAQITTAPKHIRPRLQGIKFQLEAERARSRSELGYQMRLSAMLMESFQALNAQLQDLYLDPEYTQTPPTKKTATILPFEKHR